MDKEKPQDIRERTVAFAVRVIRLYRALEKQKDGPARVIGRQFLPSATSIGTNIEEGQSAESRADFIHKYAIAQKEAKETSYWLRLMAESEIFPKQRLSPIKREAEEIYAVITAIIVKVKEKSGAEEHPPEASCVEAASP